MSFEPVPEQSPWTRLGRTAAIVGMVILAGFLVVGGASYLGRAVGNALGPGEVSDAPVDVEPGLPVTVEIPPGSSGQDIGAILAANGVVRSALEFGVAVRNVDAAQSLKAGTYAFLTLMEPAEVVAMLVSGPAPSVFRVTVVEGLRIEEILVALAEKTPHEYQDFVDALVGEEVTTSLRQMPQNPTLTDWEGLLFPDTYEFSASADAEDILQRMATTMEQRVDSIDWSAWEELGYTKYQGMVVASLIESEVKVEEERVLVSSVINNRLADGIRLEIDATVLYAMRTRDVAEFNREFDSPYNTYLIEGLPPTPISAPGRASLEAAAAPADTPFYFYVLADLEGGHAFAETFEEHQANIAQAREDGVLP
ncbi:MAG: endolytic transglycosylase MltG [Actinobacteria bacterium]|nr:endolytic transglycosylase MltG [Actinomycetota bacterium]